MNLGVVPQPALASGAFGGFCIGLRKVTVVLELLLLGQKERDSDCPSKGTARMYALAFKTKRVLHTSFPSSRSLPASLCPFPGATSRPQPQPVQSSLTQGAEGLSPAGPRFDS